MELSEIEGRLRTREAQIAVVGLGYVGLPVACSLAAAGFQVIGVDLVRVRLELIAAGTLPLEGAEPGLADLLAKVVSEGSLTVTSDYERLAGASVALVAVETPIGADHRPAYSALRSAISALAAVLPTGALLIVESTLSPGTTAEVVIPALETAGRNPGVDIWVGHCPERVMPGRLLNNLRLMSRVCGGQTPQVAACMVSLYSSIVEGELDSADLVTAELVKTAENAFRDVNIAFANELAIICEAAGGDFWTVRELVNKSPGRNVLLAGSGVGGHCIPKDPWLLAAGASTTEVRLIPAARAVNDGMPAHVAGLLRTDLEALGRPLADARVAVMGLSYLEDCGDVRASPSVTLVELLSKEGAEVRVHDPFVAGRQGPVETAVGGADALVFMVAHSAYRELDLVSLVGTMRTPIVIDTRRIFPGGEQPVTRRLGVSKRNRASN